MMKAVFDSGRIEMSNLDEHRAAVSPVQIRMEQLSQGAFQSCLESVQAGELIFYREHWTQRLKVNAVNPEDYVLIGVPVSSGIVFRGEHIDPGLVVVNPPAVEMEFSTGRVSDQLVMFVPRHLLFQYLGEESGTQVLSGRRPWRGNHQAIVSLAGTINRLLDHYLALDVLSNGGQECAAIESELLSAVTQVFTDKNLHLGRIGKPARRRALLRAIEYCKDRRQPIRVPELARVAETSQRTLEYAFKESFGISPTKYLRWSRMNKVRDELLAACPESTLVTHVAFGWGFTDLGHLAVEYRQLFGESPSTTLARTTTPPVRQIGHLQN